MSIFNDITNFIIQDKETVFCGTYIDKELKQLTSYINTLTDNGYKATLNRCNNTVRIYKPEPKSNEYFKQLMKEFLASEDTEKQFAVLGDGKASELIDIAQKEFGLIAHLEYYACGYPTLVVNKRLQPKTKPIPGQILNHVSEPEEEFIDAVYTSLKRHFDYVPVRTALRVSDDLWNELRKDLLIVKC